MRVAQCQCGGFRIAVTAEPEIVNMCHCTECQRRSGVPLTVNGYFKEAAVRLEGDYQVFARAAAEGRKLYNHFCPTCGSTLGWRADLRPGLFAVAVGAFNDKNFPAPTASIWEDSKYAWVQVPDGVQHFPRARSS